MDFEPPTACLWYIEHTTDGILDPAYILTPYPWYIEPLAYILTPTYDILTPLSMLYRNTCLLYFDLLTNPMSMVF